MRESKFLLKSKRKCLVCGARINVFSSRKMGKDICADCFGFFETCVQTGGLGKRCRKKQKCIITSAKRFHYCPGCRLSKCLTVGLEPGRFQKMIQSMPISSQTETTTTNEAHLPPLLQPVMAITEANCNFHVSKVSTRDGTREIEENSKIGNEKLFHLLNSVQEETLASLSTMLNTEESNDTTNVPMSTSRDNLNPAFCNPVPARSVYGADLSSNTPVFTLVPSEHRLPRIDDSIFANLSLEDKIFLYGEKLKTYSTEFVHKKLRKYRLLRPEADIEHLNVRWRELFILSLDSSAFKEILNFYLANWREIVKTPCTLSTDVFLLKRLCVLLESKRRLNLDDFETETLMELVVFKPYPDKCSAVGDGGDDDIVNVHMKKIFDKLLENLVAHIKMNYCDPPESLLRQRDILYLLIYLKPLKESNIVESIFFRTIVIDRRVELPVTPMKRRLSFSNAKKF